MLLDNFVYNLFYGFRSEVFIEILEGFEDDITLSTYISSNPIDSKFC